MRLDLKHALGHALEFLADGEVDFAPPAFVLLTYLVEPCFGLAHLGGVIAASKQRDVELQANTGGQIFLVDEVFSIAAAAAALGDEIEGGVVAGRGLGDFLFGRRDVGTQGTQLRVNVLTTTHPFFDVGRIRGHELQPLRYQCGNLLYRLLDDDLQFAPFLFETLIRFELLGECHVVTRLGIVDVGARALPGLEAPFGRLQLRRAGFLVGLHQPLMILGQQGIEIGGRQTDLQILKVAVENGLAAGDLGVGLLIQGKVEAPVQGLAQGDGIVGGHVILPAVIDATKHAGRPDVRAAVTAL